MQLIHNLEYGCAISYSGSHFSHCCSNLSSAFQQPSVLDNALASECSAGCILVLFQSPLPPNLHCSGLENNSGWCTIYHLSVPHRSNINEFIDPEQYSLSYYSVDDAFTIVNTLGKGATMAKIDLKTAFCLIPVRLEENLHGICWKKQYYIDTCLPFGLCTAPFLNQLFTAIHWTLQHRYHVHYLLHYLNDFFTAGSSDSLII